MSLCVWQNNEHLKRRTFESYATRFQTSLLVNKRVTLYCISSVAYSLVNKFSRKLKKKKKTIRLGVSSTISTNSNSGFVFYSDLSFMLVFL